MPGVDLEEDNNTTTRLLTLLNVSALKGSKRKRTESIEPTPRVKLNKRRSVQLDATESSSVTSKEDEGRPEAPLANASEVEDTAAAPEDIEDDQGTCSSPHHALGPQPTEFQKRSQTHTKTILARKVPTYRPYFRARWNVTAGKPADRTGGRSDPWPNPSPRVPASPACLRLETPLRCVCYSTDSRRDLRQHLSRFCRDLKSNSSLPKRS